MSHRGDTPTSFLVLIPEGRKAASESPLLQGATLRRAGRIIRRDGVGVEDVLEVSRKIVP